MHTHTQVRAWKDVKEGMEVRPLVRRQCDLPAWTFPNNINPCVHSQQNQQQHNQHLPPQGPASGPSQPTAPPFSALASQPSGTTPEDTPSTSADAAGGSSTQPQLHAAPATLARVLAPPSAATAPPAAAAGASGAQAHEPGAAQCAGEGTAVLPLASPDSAVPQDLGSSNPALQRASSSCLQGNGPVDPAAAAGPAGARRKRRRDQEGGSSAEVSSLGALGERGWERGYVNLHSAGAWLVLNGSHVDGHE